MIMNMRTVDYGNSGEEDGSVDIFTSEIDLICLEREQLSSD